VRVGEQETRRKELREKNTEKYGKGKEIHSTKSPKAEEGTEKELEKGLEGELWLLK